MSLNTDALKENFIRACAQRLICKLQIASGGETDDLLYKLEDVEDQYNTMVSILKHTSIPYRTLEREAEKRVIEDSGYSTAEIQEIFSGNGKKGQQTEKRIVVRQEPTERVEQTRWEMMMEDFVSFCKFGLEIVYRPGLNPDYPDGGKGAFFLNEHQYRVAAVLVDDMIAGRPVRAQVLKARQMGLTTVLLAFWVWLIVQQSDFKVIFLIDVNKHMFTKRDLIQNWLYGLAEKFEECPTIEFKTGSYTKLTNGSMFFYDSSESLNPGTSEFVNAVHFSEQSKWRASKVETITTSLIPGLPNKKNTFYVNESTAHGIEAFHDAWYRNKQDTSGRVRAIFIPWYLSSECVTETTEENFDADGNFIYHDEDREVGEENDLGDLVRTESMYAKKYGLSPEQVLWRRNKIKIDYKGDRRKFDQEHPTTDEHAFAGAGTLYFGAGTVKRLAQCVEEPLVKCNIKDLNGKEDPAKIQNWKEYTPSLEETPLGSLWIYNLPESGRKYVLGGDVAEGKEEIKSNKVTKDASTIVVQDDETGEVVAVYQNRVEPEWYMFDVVLIGLFYNKAKVNVERNAVGESVWGFFKQTGYPNVYLRKDGRYEDVAWEKTTKSTRPTMLTDLSAFLRKNVEKVKDARLIHEIRNFITADGKPQAKPGEHDDLVLAFAHSYRCIYKTHGLYFKEEEPEEDKPDIDTWGSIMDDYGFEEHEEDEWLLI